MARTVADIQAEITTLKAKIGRTEDKQEFTSGGPGSGAQERRGDLRAMYDRLAKLETDLERAELREANGSTAYVQFERAS